MKGYPYNGKEMFEKIGYDNLYFPFEDCFRRLQQENSKLKQKLLKIFNSIDITYDEWKEWKKDIVGGE